MQHWQTGLGLFVAALCAVVAVAHAEPVRVRIAVPAPQSGLQARLGVGVHMAAGIVAAEINDRGGVNGASIDLVLSEDPCDSRDGGRAAGALVAAKVVAVIGFPCRSTSLAVMPALGRSGLLTILTASLPGPGTVARAGPAMFQMPVAAEGQGSVIAARLVAAGQAARIAILRDKTAQAVALAQLVDVSLRAAGRAPIVVEAFTGGDKSFSAMVTRLRSLGVTHVALVAFPVEGALIARELVAASPEIEILGPDFLVAEATPALAGAALARMRLVRTVADPYGAGVHGRQLLERLTAQGVHASREALVVATAIEAWAAAAVRAGDMAPANVAAELAKGVETRFGRVEFDARGQSIVAVWGW